MTALTEAGSSYALLADGTTITIRPAGPSDYEAVKQLHREGREISLEAVLEAALDGEDAEERVA